MQDAGHMREVVAQAEAEIEALRVSISDLIALRTYDAVPPHA